MCRTLFSYAPRHQRLMGDAVLFKTAKADGEHLGPGSYDLPSTLRNGKLKVESRPADVSWRDPEPHCTVRQTKTRVSSEEV